MGVFSSLGMGRRRGARPTIRFTFAAMVALPVACLLVLWGLMLTGVLGGAMGAPDTPERDHRVVVDFMIMVGAGLVIILVGVALMGLFARRLSRDITDLEAIAQHLADEQMPQLMERLRRGEQVVITTEAPARAHTRTAEIARAQAAIASLQHTAAAAAAGEASLRKGIGQVFVSLARRNQSLLQRQLRLIDALEQKASDPATLADLFPLDHLTTRMRRHAEGLIILSGAAPGRSWSEPVPVIDVVRGAVAEIEDYKRVTVLTRAEDAVAGLAAADMIHLLAELIENATLSSPSGTRVEVRAERVANGFAIEIDDRGLGIETGQLRTINQQLAQPPDFDLADADQLGLFVVGKLAARHGVRVALRPSPYGGTTAVVLMPNSIVVPMNETDADTQPDLRPAIGRTPGLDLRNADALVLTGHYSPQPSLSMGVTGQAENHSQAGNHSGGSTPAQDSTGTLPRRSGFGTGPSAPGSDGTGGTGGYDTAPFAASPGGTGRTGFSASPAGFGTSTSGSDPGPSAAGPGSTGLPVDASGNPGAAAPGLQTAGTYRGLPRRVRQANLNPHLRNSAAAAARGIPGDGPPPSDARSPEETRNLVASLQSGWQRGRETDDPEGESADADQTARRQDSEAPHGEEALWMSRARPGRASS